MDKQQKVINVSVNKINKSLSNLILKCGEIKSTKIIHDERGFITSSQDTKNNKRIL